MSQENNTTIRIIDVDGMEKEAEVLLYFKLEENGKEYLIYTFNEAVVDENGVMSDDLVVVHTSEVLKKEDDVTTLGAVDDEDEWGKIKDVMRDIIKETEE